MRSAERLTQSNTKRSGSRMSTATRVIGNLDSSVKRHWNNIFKTEDMLNTKIYRVEHCKLNTTTINNNTKAYQGQIQSSGSSVSKISDPCIAAHTQVPMAITAWQSWNVPSLQIALWRRSSVAVPWKSNGDPIDEVPERLALMCSPYFVIYFVHTF